jgi:hypothetical protein
VISFIPTLLAEEPGDANANEENQNDDQPWRLAGGMLKPVQSRRLRGIFGTGGMAPLTRWGFAAQRCTARTDEDR